MQIDRGYESGFSLNRFQWTPWRKRANILLNFGRKSLVELTLCNPQKPQAVKKICLQRVFSTPYIMNKIWGTCVNKHFY